MRIIVVAVLALVAGAIPGWSDDIYRWTDSEGAVHFSNTPSGAHEPERVPETERSSFGSEPGSNAGTSGTSDRDGNAAAPDDSFSTSASLQRNALERELRATDRRLHELDARLASLGRARTRLSGGNASTGGVGTRAGDFRSEEEKALAEEREQVAKRADDIRANAGKLRDEVAARLGGTPPWWVDIR